MIKIIFVLRFKDRRSKSYKGNIGKVMIIKILEKKRFVKETEKKSEWKKNPKNERCHIGYEKDRMNSMKNI